MKKILLAALLSLTMVAPAHAFKLSVRKIVGAPFALVGFTAAAVADLTVVPMYKGAKHYIYEPAIKGW